MLTGVAYDPAHLLVQLSPGADAKWCFPGAEIVDTISLTTIYSWSANSRDGRRKMLDALEGNPYVSLSQPDEVHIE